MKLGKLAPRHDPRTLKLARYLTAALPPPPVVADWTTKVTVPWGVQLNNSLGDCTCAAASHLVLSWTANASSPVVVSDNDTLTLYEKACGYNPADPSTDQGGVELDVLNFWRQNGIGSAGHPISAYASVNPKNVTEVQQAINLFGGVYTGVALPTSAQAQVGTLWDVTASTPDDAGSWGGHAVPGVAYDTVGLTFVTWGNLQKATWAWFEAYCDEAYAIITQDWIEANGDAPSGFDLATLQADLAAIT